jgi:hypothetical protein
VIKFETQRHRGTEEGIERVFLKKPRNIFGIAPTCF